MFIGHKQKLFVFFSEHYGFAYNWYSYLHCSLYASFRYLYMFCLANISISERITESLYHTGIFKSLSWFPELLDLNIYCYPLCWPQNLLYKWCICSTAKYLCLFIQPCLILKCFIQLSFFPPNVCFSICVQPLSYKLGISFLEKIQVCVFLLMDEVSHSQCKDLQKCCFLSFCFTFCTC